MGFIEKVTLSKDLKAMNCPRGDLGKFFPGRESLRCKCMGRSVSVFKEERVGRCGWSRV